MCVNDCNIYHLHHGNWKCQRSVTDRLMIWCQTERFVNASSMICKLVLRSVPSFFTIEQTWTYVNFIYERLRYSRTRYYSVHYKWSLLDTFLWCVIIIGACDFYGDSECVLRLVKFSHYRSNRRQTGYSRPKMAKSPKINESWDVTPCSIAFFEKIPNLSGLLVRNGKIPRKACIMSCRPLYHCVFGEDYESVLGLTLFGHLTGKLHVKSI